MRNPRGIERGFNLPPQEPDDFFYMARAFQSSKVLLLADEMEIWTALSGKAMTAEELSAELGVNAADLEKLLIACAAMDLLVVEEGRFCNSLAADRYLVRGRPGFVGDGIAQTSGWWQRYHEYGENMLAQYRAHRGEFTDEDWHQRFIRAMDQFASTGDAQLLAESIDLSGRKRLLDVGGGPGTYSVFFCKQYPELRATILDLPQTEPIFREMMEKYGTADRISFIAGDLETTPWGEGYDAILVSNMTHGTRGEIIPPKAFDALSPGGMIIIRDYILYPDKSGPLDAALFNAGMGAYTEDELLDFLSSAGFTDCARLELQGHTILLACKPGI